MDEKSYEFIFFHNCFSGARFNVSITDVVFLGRRSMDALCDAGFVLVFLYGFFCQRIQGGNIGMGEAATNQCGIACFLDKFQTASKKIAVKTKKGGLKWGKV